MLLSVWSLGTGATNLDAARILAAIARPETAGEDAVVLWQVRLPRLLAALAAGAGLAVAGVVAQAMTRNPLAEPGLLGINSGAAFAVVAVTLLTGGLAGSATVGVAICGAAATAALVLALGSVGRSGTALLRIILAGVIIGGFLGSLTAAILILDSQTLEEVRFWTVGSLRNRELRHIAPAVPFLLLGLAAALALSREFDTLALGDAAAEGLGQKQAVWRAVSVALVVTLAGSAVSVAGPIGFVGLVVPHVVRLALGPAHGGLLPGSALTGMALMVLADTLPRALAGIDIPVGVTMALVGAPAFVLLIHLRSPGTGRA